MIAVFFTDMGNLVHRIETFMECETIESKKGKVLKTCIAYLNFKKHSAYLKKKLSAYIIKKKFFHFFLHICKNAISDFSLSFFEKYDKYLKL